ncbi:hypothetical protein AB1Y20_006769 [Prymnesium parvum]|uniref:Uncharacterized protein n=1 Tax=Prymnesium parvum TaxID=97485 RepID=A0AB34IZD0_PRYPA
MTQTPPREGTLVPPREGTVVYHFHKDAVNVFELEEWQRRVFRRLAEAFAHENQSYGIKSRKDASNERITLDLRDPDGSIWNLTKAATEKNKGKIYCDSLNGKMFTSFRAVRDFFNAHPDRYCKMGVGVFKVQKHDASKNVLIVESPSKCSYSIRPPWYLSVDEAENGDRDGLEKLSSPKTMRANKSPLPTPPRRQTEVIYHAIDESESEQDVECSDVQVLTCESNGGASAADKTVDESMGVAQTSGTATLSRARPSTEPATQPEEAPLRSAPRDESMGVAQTSGTATLSRARPSTEPATQPEEPPLRSAPHGDESMGVAQTSGAATLERQRQSTEPAPPEAEAPLRSAPPHPDTELLEVVWRGGAATIERQRQSTEPAPPEGEAPLRGDESMGVARTSGADTLPRPKQSAEPALPREVEAPLRSAPRGDESMGVARTSGGATLSRPRQLAPSGEAQAPIHSKKPREVTATPTEPPAAAAAASLSLEGVDTAEVARALHLTWLACRRKAHREEGEFLEKNPSIEETTAFYNEREGRLAKAFQEMILNLCTQTISNAQTNSNVEARKKRPRSPAR